jgi:uncharacterized integral membrane protein (TIGR00698 family)
MININKVQKQDLFSRTNARTSSNLSLGAGGSGFTFLFALLAYGLAKIPGFDHIGPLACSIIMAVIYRQIWGYPEKIRFGIEFSSKKLLRYAIILYGLKLNIDVVIHQGLGLLLRDVGTALFAIVLTIFLAKWMKADSGLSLLLGIGTGICGAAAIAAVSPIIKAKEEDTAIGAGIIALVGTLFAIGYTILRPYLHLTNIQYGIWSGVGLHEIAHVALAAAPAGRDALAIGLLAKLGRVLLLVPLSFILMYWMKRTKIEFPWFLIGFIIMSIFGSYVVGEHLVLPKTIMDDISTLTTFLLTMAMVGLGLNVSIKTLRTKALKPLIAMFITSILLSFFTFLTM